MHVLARVSDHLSQSTCLETLHPKTDKHVNPSVEMHHLVGKLSTAETLLNEVHHLVGKLSTAETLLNEVHHLVGKLSMAETLLTEVLHKVPL